MPELPEVETVVNQLSNKLVGRKIIDVNVNDQKVIDSKIKKYLHFKIKSIQRRGKSIVFKLNNNLNLLAHLRMTGHFHYVKDNNQNHQTYKKYLAAKFHLDDNSFFTYNTIRRFGSVTLLDNDQLTKSLSHLGPEPLEDSFTANNFKDLMKKFPQANLKNKLLDQTFIVGIGNIYAQEAMYHAKIHPERKVGEVSQQKLNVLYHELRRVMFLSIENNGTTVQNYSHIDGKGNFQNFLAVYNQSKCPQKHPLSKLSIGGRGTYFCSKCQQ